MSFISFNKFNRSKLSEEQRTFLSRLVSWAGVIQDYCLHKAIYRRIYSPVGIRASVIISDILLRSDWGNHPISQKRCLGKAANNLSLIESNELWEQDHKSIEFGDCVKYRCYEDWAQYAQDASDLYVGSGNYDKVLLLEKVEDQSKAFCEALGRVAGYDSQLLLLITEYGLQDFDLKYG